MSDSIRRRNKNKGSPKPKKQDSDQLALPNKARKPTSKIRRFLRLVVLASLVFVIIGILAAISAGIYHNIKLRQEREALKHVRESFQGESVPFRNGTLFAQCSRPKEKGRDKLDIWLVNGLGGLLSDWEFIYNKLALLPGVRVCRYDPSSFGFSDQIIHEEDEETFEFYVEQLRTLYNYYDPSNSRPKILVGHSLGGLTARLATHLYASQDHIIGTVLIDSTTENTYDLFLKPYNAAFHYLFDILGSLEYIGFSRLSSGYGIHPMEAYLQLLDVPSREISQHFYSTPEHWAAVKLGFSRMERGCDWAKTVFKYYPWHHSSQIRVISASDVESFVKEEDLEGPSVSELHIQEQRRVYESYDESIRGTFTIAEDCTHFLHLQRPAYVLQAVQELYDEWKITHESELENGKGKTRQN